MVKSFSGIIENYLEYTNGYFPTILQYYINMYGKEGLYMYLPTANEPGGENIYVNSFGKENSAFNYASDLVTKIPVKLLADYTDWYKSYAGNDIDVMMYFSTKVHHRLNEGDMFMHENNGKQLFYRIIEPVDTYQELLYRCTAKLIQTKSVTETRRDRDLL